MNFLLDTNVVSEWAKPQPDPGVVRWLSDVDEDRAFLSVITLAELQFRVERLPANARRDHLAHWLEDDLFQRFESRLLPVDADVARAFGSVMARRQATGRPVSAMDALIAATAMRHTLALVTRNTADFELLGLELVNPWAAP